LVERVGPAAAGLVGDRPLAEAAQARQLGGVGPDHPAPPWIVALVRAEPAAPDPGRQSQEM
jgi:hypothetical protein